MPILIKSCSNLAFYRLRRKNTESTFEADNFCLAEGTEKLQTSLESYTVQLEVFPETLIGDCLGAKDTDCLGLKLYKLG